MKTIPSINITCIVKVLLPFLFFLCPFHQALAQTITWEKQFHFDQWSEAGQIIETEDSGFFELTGDISENPDALWLIKLNKEGNFIWEKLIDSSGGGILSIIKKSPGLYMTIVFAKKPYIMEFNESGNILWTKGYDPADHYDPYGLFALSNGNYFLEAALASPGNYQHYYTPGKMLLQKFGSNHNLLWSDTFNFGSQTGSSGIIITSQNRVFIGGEVGSGGINHAFAFVLLLDTNGKKLNYVPYPPLSDSSEQVEYIGQLKNGNLLVESCNSSFGSFFFTLADSMGNTIKRWNIGGYHNGTGGFVEDGDSVILLASAGLLTGPLTLQKFDTAFREIWEKEYDIPSYYFNQPQQILRTSDGGLLLTGTRSTSTFSDMVLIKVNNNGYCAGEDLSDISNPTTTTNEVSVYPNPATDNIYFHTGYSDASLGIDIFDSRGVKVMSVETTLPRIQSLDISNLSKGLYMYRLYNKKGVYKEGKFVKE